MMVALTQKEQNVVRNNRAPVPVSQLPFRADAALEDGIQRFSLIEGTHLPWNPLGDGAQMVMIQRNAPAANDPSFGARAVKAEGKVGQVAAANTTSANDFSYATKAVKGDPRVNPNLSSLVC